MSALAQTEPKQHFWDSWTHFEASSQQFHVFRLTAPLEAFRDGRHHLVSRLAYAVSHNLNDLVYLSLDLIEPAPNASIWSGCTIQRSDGQYMLFYTERSERNNYWAHQTIHCAASPSLEPGSWTKIPEMALTPEALDPEGKHFLRSARPGDRTVHAWRDPFVFTTAGETFMLLSAKLAQENGYATRDNAACIALLKATDRSLYSWTLVNPAIVKGFEELELPQLFRDKASGELVLATSTFNEDDYKESRRCGANPFNPVDPYAVRRNGGMLIFRAGSFDDVLKGAFTAPEWGVGFEERMYASIIVPERSGAVIGFDLDTAEYRVLPDRFPQLERL